MSRAERRRRYIDKKAAILNHPDSEKISRGKIFKRDNYHCGICGYYVHPRERSLDHIKPLGKGGTHTRDNVQLAHVSCNSKKSDQYEE